jgi:hypothetical protein
MLHVSRSRKPAAIKHSVAGQPMAGENGANLITGRPEGVSAKAVFMLSIVAPGKFKNSCFSSFFDRVAGMVILADNHPD